MGESFALRGYVVERPLGRGASGDVWRARAAASGAPVALKRILTADDDERARACSEAALLRALDHPNLIRLHAVVPTRDAVVLVLDLADGGSLEQLLRARGRLAPGEVITAVAPVAAALAYLHEGGVVHGDVTPGNVLFTAAGMPLLADVGVARLIGQDDAVRATPAYVDPTVAAGHLPGPPSDVFMLAGVALHALTGTPPWPGEPAAALSAAAGAAGIEVGGASVAADAARRLATAGAPAPMVEVLVRALDRDPARRGSAADLALDLRHAGRPVAVELGAGTAREPVSWSGPRHAARTDGAAGRAAGADRTGDHTGDRTGDRAGDRTGDRAGAERAGVEDPARPSFERPREVPAAEPPTRMVGPRPRPLIPRPPERRRGQRRLWLAGVAVAVVIAAAGGIAWATTGRSASGPDRPRAQIETVQPSDGQPAPGRTTARPGGPSTSPSAPVSSSPPASPSAPVSSSPPASRSAPVSSSPSVARSPSAARSPSPGADPRAGTGPGWALAALDRLDAGRERAFATRDATALRRVYASPDLLATDVALLRRLVPPGCGLRGVRTRYRSETASAATGGATLVVSATLASSQLVCGGRVRATLPGAGPSRLRVELVRTGDGPRIARQEVIA